MSCGKLWCALACVAAAGWLAAPARAVPSGLLSQLADKSICESVIEYDDNPDRIPRIIKHVKCAAQPDKMCPARDGAGQVSCCKQNSYLNTMFSCREVIDTVMVTDTQGVPSHITASVGCACVMQQSVQAEEV